MKKGLIKILLMTVLVLAVATPAMAEKVLRWASQGDALTFDPMSQNEGPTITASRQIYETLVIRNYRQEKEPCLATS